MRYSSTTSVLLALFAVKESFAGPPLSHLHQRHHQKRELHNVNWDALDWDAMGIDWATAYAEGQPAAKSKPNPTPNSVPELAAKPETSPSSIAATSPSPAKISSTLITAPETDAHVASASDSEPSDKLPSDSNENPSLDPDTSHNSDNSHESKPSKPKNSEPSRPSSSKHGSSAKLWNGLVGASNNRKSFGLATPTYGKEVSYVSNVGIPEGSNMMKVASTEGHTFTNKFINTSKDQITVVIWNKAASPGMKDPLNADPNLGASIAPEHAALTIALEPQESQTVAFMDQSVISWAQACETRAMSGGFQTTWGEAQFNTTGSGYDVSAIQNKKGSNYLMQISSVEASSCDSTETTNMWITDTTTVGSGSCYIAQSTAHLITKMGGYAS